MPLPTVDELRKEIVESCDLCEGRGYQVSFSGEKGRFSDCECMKKLKSFMALLEVGVPPRFWDFDFSMLTSEYKKKNSVAVGQIRLWLKSLPDVISEGAGLLLWSKDHGAAKTALAAVLAKEAMRLESQVAWVWGTDLFDVFLSRARREPSPVLERVEHADLVIIDEIDKIYLPKEEDSDPRMTRSFACEFFDRIYRETTAVIATGNRSIEGMEESDVLPSAVIDRIGEWDQVEFSGIKYRRKRSMMQRLVDNTDG